MRFKMLALSPAAFLGRKVKLFGPRNMIKMMATCAWCPHHHLPYAHLPYPRTGTVHAYGWRRARRNEADKIRAHLDEGVENFAEVDARDGHLQLKGRLHTVESSEKCRVRNRDPAAQAR